MEKTGYVYILTNGNRNVLYTGVTSELKIRIYKHKMGLIDSFAKKRGCTILVYYEECGTIYNAIAWEKQIKAGSRQKKIDLITKMNPEWRDLYDTL
jgi:putative endonuclease